MSVELAGQFIETAIENVDAAIDHLEKATAHMHVAGNNLIKVGSLAMLVMQLDDLKTSIEVMLELGTDDVSLLGWQDL